MRSPAAFYGTPTYALHLAQVAADEGLNPRDFRLRFMFFSGEPGASIPGVRDRIEELYGAKVFDSGSMAEMTPWMNVAGSRETSGMLCWQDIVYTEVCDPKTMHRVAYGQRGTPVYTHLERTSQPMIRMASGDLTQWVNEPNPCGRTYPRLPTGVFGRIDDMFTIRGENVYPSEIDAVLNALPRYGGEHRIVISRESSMDELLLRVEADSATFNSGADQIGQFRDEVVRRCKSCLACEGVRWWRHPAAAHRLQGAPRDRRPRVSRRIPWWRDRAGAGHQPAAIGQLARRGRHRRARELADLPARPCAVISSTGVPGVTSRRWSAGGSCAKDTKVGIVAIDPSSPYSGGAILGDRIRMTELATDPGVYIRSMATRGATGGMARAALDAVDILDVAGYQTIIIETVGVGQDEVEIARASHTTVVVSAPGLGDEIQAIKAGILEIADIHVVSKCDRSDASRTITDLKQMLMLGLRDAPKSDWSIPVVGTSAISGEGLDDLVTAIGRHRSVAFDTESGRRRRIDIARFRLRKTAENLLLERFAQDFGACAAPLVERLAGRTGDPYSLAEELLKLIAREESP
jgi:LAO/AO transport system ATPase